MSGYKTSRAELVAIYRLEFYRKQKHWKLSHETSQKAATTKKLLNQTYDVKKPHIEEDAGLDVAFCETSSNPDAQNATINLAERSQKSWPILTRTSLELLQSQLSLPEAATTLEQYKDLPEQNLPLQTKEQEIQSEWANTEDIWLNNWASVPIVQWPNNEPVLTDPGPTYEELTGLNKATGGGDHGFQSRWPKDSQSWINTEQIMPEVAWCKEVQEAEAAPTPEGLASAADAWLFAQGLAHHRQWCAHKGEALLERSVDSAAEFMRGAHAAPHSSEVEISLPESEAECACEAAALSRGQLNARVQRHARALRVLLHEASARDKHNHHLQLSQSLYSYPGTPLYDGSSCDELPTRDVGIHRPPSGMQARLDSSPQPPHFNDVILAGSFRNVMEADVPTPNWGGLGSPAGVGRGRGRLHKGEQRLGLGRGRLNRF